MIDVGTFLSVWVCSTALYIRVMETVQFALGHIFFCPFYLLLTFALPCKSHNKTQYDLFRVCGLLCGLLWTLRLVFRLTQYAIHLHTMLWLAWDLPQKHIENMQCILHHCWLWAAALTASLKMTQNNFIWGKCIEWRVDYCPVRQC